MATLGDLEKKIQVLQRKIQVLEDLEAIRELKVRYGQICDGRYGVKDKKKLKALAREVIELFSDDAIWDGGKQFGIYRGKKDIYEFFTQPSYNFGLHYFVRPDLSINGNKASGRWYLLMPATMKDNTAVWMAGFEDDEYVKSSGQWLCSHMKLTISFLTPYDQGWAKKRMIGSQLSQRLKPNDR